MIKHGRFSASGKSKVPPAAKRYEAKPPVFQAGKSSPLKSRG